MSGAAVTTWPSERWESSSRRTTGVRDYCVIALTEGQVIRIAGITRYRTRLASSTS